MKLLYRTYQPSIKEVKREWHLVDAKGEVLGRLASGVAILLMGKHKSVYTPHLDFGDFVVVVNAKEVKVTGRKEEQKTYFRHSGYPGGLRAVNLRELRKKNPARIIEKAVYNMLPGNRLRRERMNRLKVFAGEENPYENKFEARSTKFSLREISAKSETNSNAQN